MKRTGMHHQVFLYFVVVLGGLFSSTTNAAIAINDTYSFSTSDQFPLNVHVIDNDDVDVDFNQVTLSLRQRFTNNATFNVVTPADGYPFFEVTPDAGFTTGSIEFNYTVSDPAGSSEAFVRIDVTDTGLDKLVDDTYFVSAGASVTFNVVDNDTIIETGFNTIADTSGLTGGSLVNNPAVGSYTFTAGTGAGESVFTYSVDSVAGQTAEVTIFVDSGSTPKSTVDATISGASAINEGDTRQITLTRSGSTQEAISIQIALKSGSTADGADFNLSQNTISWAAGDGASKSVTLSVNQDVAIEPVESLVLEFINPTGGAEYIGSDIITTISATDNVNFVSASYSILEDAGSVSVEVVRTGTGTGAASINLFMDTGSTTATIGSDFTFTDPTTVSWDAGETGNKTVTIPIIADSDAFEGTENIVLNLGATNNVFLGSTPTTTVSITNVVPIDVVSFVSATYSVAEDAGSVTVQVQRIGSGAGATSLIVVLAGAETAVEGSDFTFAASVAVNWADSETGTKDIVIPIATDLMVEGSETFSLSIGPSLSNATLGTNSTTRVTISDVVTIDVVSFVNTNYSIAENGGSVRVQVQRLGNGVGVVSLDVELAATETATEGSDFVFAENAVVNWLDGETGTKDIAIPITLDVLAEGNETFSLSLLASPTNAILGSNTSAQITIVDSGITEEAGLDAIGFANTVHRAAEELGAVDIPFVRTGSGSGPVEVQVSFVINQPGDGGVVPAQAGDFSLPSNAVVAWADGEVGVKVLTIGISQDSSNDADGDPDGEFFTLTLDPDSLVGNAIVEESAGEAKVVIFAQELLGNIVDEDSPVKEVAVAIDTICSNTTDNSALEECAKLSELDAAEIEQTLEIIRPKTVEAQIESAVELAGNQMQNLRKRLSELRSGRNQVSLAGLNMSLFDESVPLPAAIQSILNESTGGAAGSEGGLLDSPWGVFINGTLSVGEQDDVDDSLGYDIESKGITAGLDYRINPNMILGTAIGFGRSDSDFNQASGSQDSKSITLTVFGNHFINNKIYADWVVSYTQNDFDIKRNLKVLGTTHNISASPEGYQYSLAIGGGYDYAKGALQLTGFGRIDYISTTIDSYSESGSFYALSLSKQKESSLETAFGVKSSYVFNTKKAVFIPSAELEWVHQYNEDSRTIEAAFAQLPSAGSFSIETEQSDQDHLNAAFSMSATFSGGKSAFFRYDTLLGEDDRDSESYTLGGRYEF